MNLVEKKDYAVVGEPEDLQSARAALALEDRYQFQWWALSLVKARPLGAAAESKTGKKGSDKGIDGLINFVDDRSGKPKRVTCSGQKRQSKIRRHPRFGRHDHPRKRAHRSFYHARKTVEDMLTEAATAGFYHSERWNRDYPKLQILSIEDLMTGAEIKMPPTENTFKKAQKVHSAKKVQPNFLDDDDVF